MVQASAKIKREDRRFREEKPVWLGFAPGTAGQMRAFGRSVRTSFPQGHHGFDPSRWAIPGTLVVFDQAPGVGFWGGLGAASFWAFTRGVLEDSAAGLAGTACGSARWAELTVVDELAGPIDGGEDTGFAGAAAGPPARGAAWLEPCESPS